MWSLNWMPPWSSLRAVTRGCADVQWWWWCEKRMYPCHILCPFGAMCRLQTEMLLLEVCCQHVLILHGPAGSSGRVATAVINTNFSGINSFLHSLWPGSPYLHAANLFNTYKPHEAVFNLSQKPSKWFLEYAVSIWPSCQVWATHHFSE